jgi:hypothetical protein
LNSRRRDSRVLIVPLLKPLVHGGSGAGRLFWGTSVNHDTRSSCVVNSRLVGSMHPLQIRILQEDLNVGGCSGGCWIRLAGLHRRGASGETSHRRTYCRPWWNAFSRSRVSWAVDEAMLQEAVAKLATRSSSIRQVAGMSDRINKHPQIRQEG